MEDTVLDRWECFTLQRIHDESEQRRRVERSNALIVGVAQSLLTYSRTVDWKADLKEVIKKANSKTEYEVTLFHYTRIHWKFGEEFTGTWEDRNAAYQAAEREDSKVSHLPVAVSTPISEDQRAWALSEAFNYKYLTLALLSHYLGPNLKVVSRTGDTFYEVPGLFSAKHARLVIKYFPGGVPLGEDIPLNRAKEIWGLKTTEGELADAAWGGQDDAATVEAD